MGWCLFNTLKFHQFHENPKDFQDTTKSKGFCVQEIQKEFPRTKNLRFLRAMIGGKIVVEFEWIVSEFALKTSSLAFHCQKPPLMHNKIITCHPSHENRRFSGHKSKALCRTPFVHQKSREKLCFSVTQKIFNFLVFLISACMMGGFWQQKINSSYWHLR